MRDLPTLIAVLATGIGLGVIGTLAVLWWNPWPPEPDGHGRPVVCDPGRDSCWQRGWKVQAPDFYEDCKPETEGGYAGVWLSGEGTDEQSPFDYVYACFESDE